MLKGVCFEHLFVHRVFLDYFMMYLSNISLQGKGIIFLLLQMNDNKGGFFIQHCNCADMLMQEGTRTGVISVVTWLLVNGEPQELSLK